VSTRTAVVITPGVHVATVVEAASVAQAVSRDDCARAVHDRHRAIARSLREVACLAAVMQRVPNVPGRRIAVHRTAEAVRDQIRDEFAEAIGRARRNSDRLGCGRDRGEAAAVSLDRGVAVAMMPVWKHPVPTVERVPMARRVAPDVSRAFPDRMLTSLGCARTGERKRGDKRRDHEWSEHG